MILVYSSTNFFHVLLLSEYFSSVFSALFCFIAGSTSVFPVDGSISVFFVESFTILLFATQAESAFRFPLKRESLNDFCEKQVELINKTSIKNVLFIQFKIRGVCKGIL